MKAIVKQELVKKSWSGRTVISTNIIGTKENIVNKVNEYISQRISETNLIPVKRFYIEIQTQTGKRVNYWEYSPTYRYI